MQTHLCVLNWRSASLPVASLALLLTLSSRSLVLGAAFLPNPSPNLVRAELSISGKISDEKGEILPGVSVLVKGTARGTTTDAGGNYQLRVPDAEAVLVFSFVGYEPQEVPVGNRTTINIKLRADEKSLNEVVVVGYGTQKRVNLTGAVSQVDAEVIENRPVQNALSALQGTLAGVTIQRVSGQPGRENFNVQIRGATSTNGGGALVLIDGVPGQITDINPNDILSVSVLKDAAAAAIYGAQAAGGVVLVTTKRGQNGKTVIEYSGLYGVATPINTIERISSADEARYVNLSRINAGLGAEYTDQDLAWLEDPAITYQPDPVNPSNYRYYANTDWVKEGMRRFTQNQNHNLSIRGGDEKNQYLLSLGYYQNGGLLRYGPDGNKRYNFRIGSTTQFNRYLNLDSRLSVTLNNIEQQPGGVGGTIGGLYKTRSLFPVYNPDGTYASGPGNVNPIAAMIENGRDEEKNRNLQGVFTLRAANFVKGLELRAIYGQQYNVKNTTRVTRTYSLFNKSGPQATLNSPNSFLRADETFTSSNLQLLADYDLTLAQKHNFHLLGGYQFERSGTSGISGTTRNFPVNDLPSLAFGDELLKTTGEGITARAFQSVFGRLNYNYAEKYLLEAVVRADESSILAPGRRRKVYPSFSAGWRVSQEAWFGRILPVFTDFKFRASYGKLGNVSALRDNNFAYLPLLSIGNNYPFNDQRNPVVTQNTLASETITWEDVKTINGGIDVGLFKNRFTASFDYYEKRNENLLTTLQLPSVLGIATSSFNKGELKTWGYDITMGWRDALNTNFNYFVNVNFSDNQNRVIRYDGRQTYNPGSNGIIEGRPLDSYYGYLTDGYFQTPEEVKSHAFLNSNNAPGDVKYRDLNGDNKISNGLGREEDRGDVVFLGSPNPRYLFGTNLGFTWKNFDFTVFLQGVFKRNVLFNNVFIQPLQATFIQPDADQLDYWTPDNRNARYPRPYIASNWNYLPSDKWVENAAYLRLKNLQLGYTLPSRLTKRVGVSKARFYFSGQDLWEYTKLPKKFDAELRDNSNNDYPFMRTYAMGLNLTF